MVKKLDLTQEQAHWFAEQILEWGVANIGSILVTEIGIEHTIGRGVNPDNIETAIEVIQNRLSDSSLDSTLVSILGVLGIKALAEQISKEDKTFDLEAAWQVCDTYASEHRIDIHGASVPMLVRLIHTLKHPDLPDVLDHSDGMITDAIHEVRKKISTGELVMPHSSRKDVLDSSQASHAKSTISHFEELRKFKRSTASAGNFIGLALDNMTEPSVEKVAAEMKNIIFSRRPITFMKLYESDARGG